MTSVVVESDSVLLRAEASVCCLLKYRFAASYKSDLNHPYSLLKINNVKVP